MATNKATKCNLGDETPLDRVRAKILAKYPNWKDGTIDSSCPFFSDYIEALRDTDLEKLIVGWDKPLQHEKYAGFVSLLATNKTIQTLKMTFWGINDEGISFDDEEIIFSLLVEKGGSIHLKSLRIESLLSGSSKAALLMTHLPNLLHQHPALTRELQLWFSAPTDDERTILLESVFCSQIESFSVLNGWCKPDHFVTAMQQHSSCRLVSLGFDCLLYNDDCFENFVDKIPSMQNIQRLKLQGFNVRYLEVVCRAVAAHGNIKCLDMEWLGEELVTNMTATISERPVNFRGLNEIALAVRYFPVGENQSRRKATAIRYLCSCLNGNPSLQRMKISLTTMSLARFQNFTELLPSLPSLEVVEIVDDFGFPYRLGISYMNLILTAIKSCNRLWKVIHDKSTPKLDNRQGAVLLDEIAYYCERNRIDLPGLLAPKESMGMGLWPLILSKVRHTSVLFQLLRSKPDLIVTALGVSANRGVKHKRNAETD
jgi:hypothetical protein